jgi:hypothetical protein
MFESIHVANLTDLPAGMNGTAVADVNRDGLMEIVADFDAEKCAITNAKPFANEQGKPVRFAYPRWTKDEAGIVYHAGGKLYLYTLANGSTKKVSTDDSANHIYPHGEATPK